MSWRGCGRPPTGARAAQLVGPLDDAKLLGAVRSVVKPFGLHVMLAAVKEELDRLSED